ncbi:DEAD/DEAH box helicase [uncultured Aeromicrobium sp.]|uniref:DEAD/DEAH box helicase n=1 Tax=uncultured Aeromicrobium sp. TaxID=337820 RepID=UPI0025FC7A81|nr:DEAD/DEAH box helicase [uncultured Aeromicrobium sp.]
MTTETLEEVVLGSERFRATLARLTRDAVTADLPAVRPTEGEPEVDWPFALLCSSALTGTTDHAGQEAALRVAHSCLASDTDETIRSAAVVILERLGNRQSLGLAARRGLINGDAWLDSPGPLQQDVIRRRLELTIPTKTRGDLAANSFQREFWSSATTSRWLSISAPTSAGKSFIVKRWLEDQASTDGEFKAVYVVPTRALIEEVSLDLIDDFGRSVRVHTMPWDSEIGEYPKEVFVLTQERLHLLQQRLPTFAPSLVFIDEAQKFDDGSRGVLLQQVLDETVRRAPGAQIIFASPLTSNPEILLTGAPDGASLAVLNSQAVTVNQNLLVANQVRYRPREWTLSLSVDGELDVCGTFVLPARPTPASKRLPLVAVTLGGMRSGNVVYVNGAADAEKAAKQVYEALGPEADISEDEDIAALRELAVTAVHPQYALEEVLRRGVAFHYGNMPLLLKSEIERLFKEEKLRYLVCTSTLLEGVNLPCKNLFVRGPRKGRGKVMSAPDFWNLAGRAGRWGKEFQGNIVCIDTNDQQQWPTPPTSRVRQPISRASDHVFAELGSLTEYIDADTPVEMSRESPLLEPVFSLLASRVARGDGVSTIVGVAIEGDSAVALEGVISSALGNVTFPPELIERHAGISPLSMQRLLDSFREYADPANLVLPPPESPDAAENYVRAIAKVNRELGGDWGPEGRQYQLAILITQWMRGMPLSRLISDRLSYARRVENTNIPGVIRGVMSDVEQIARFQAPKYLACYQDLLRAYADEVGSPIFEDLTFDVSMMLELGVSRPTEVALMALGLSRTTTIALSELIIEDDLAPQQALEWLQVQDIEALSLPALVRREIRNRLAAEDYSETL